MDLHHHTTHDVTQLETLMMQTGVLLDALARESVGFKTDGLLQHLRNSIALLGGEAQGYAWTVDQMLQQISVLADAGEIPPGAASLILAPAYMYLGDAYTQAAMATVQNG